jgi:hypothetical protein
LPINPLATCCASTPIGTPSFWKEGSTPKVNSWKLTECFRRRVIGLFLRKNLITESFSEMLLRWRHSGFSVNNSVRMAGDDHKARVSLAQYIARAPLSLEKLSNDELDGKALYHSTYNPFIHSAAGPATYPLLWIVFVAQPMEMAPVAARGSSRPTGMEVHTRARQHEPETRATQAYTPRMRLTFRMGAADRSGVRGQSHRRQLAAKRTARARWSVLAAELIVQSIDLTVGRWTGKP